MSRLLRGRLAALAILLAVAAPVGGQLITDESADKQDRAEDLGRSHGAARAEVDRPKPVYPLAERDRRIHGLKPFQELVDAAPAGSILKPPPGTYAGPVSVKKPLTIDGGGSPAGTSAHSLGEAFDSTDSWKGTQRAVLLAVALVQP